MVSGDGVYSGTHTNPHDQIVTTIAIHPGTDTATSLPWIASPIAHAKQRGFGRKLELFELRVSDELSFGQFPLFNAI
jgi:hypothetical protein